MINRFFITLICALGIASISNPTIADNSDSGRSSSGQCSKCQDAMNNGPKMPENKWGRAS
jgi:hypothetical protein